MLERHTRELLDAIYADHGATPRFQRPTICVPSSGVITKVEHKALVRIAEAGDCVLTLLPALGEFVPAGAQLFEISWRDRTLLTPTPQSLGPDRPRAHSRSRHGLWPADARRYRRTSLSDGPFLDPTTAVQAIDRLYDCLRQLVPRPFPDGRHRDAKGEVRLVTRP